MKKVALLPFKGNGHLSKYICTSLVCKEVFKLHWSESKIAHSFEDCGKCVEFHIFQFDLIGVFKPRGTVTCYSLRLIKRVVGNYYRLIRELSRCGIQRRRLEIPHDLPNLIK